MKNKGSLITELAFGLGIIGFIILLIIAVKQEQYEKQFYKSKAYYLFNGKHELKALGDYDKLNSSRANGSLFWIFGSYHSESNEIKTVTVAWKNKLDYILTTVPIDKIRVRIDNSVEIPYILFRWTGSEQCDYMSDSDIIKNNIIYIVIVCKDGMWNPKINMPLE